MQVVDSQPYFFQGRSIICRPCRCWHLSPARNPFYTLGHEVWEHVLHITLCWALCPAQYECWARLICVPNNMLGAIITVPNTPFGVGQGEWRAQHAGQGFLYMVSAFRIYSFIRFSYYFGLFSCIFIVFYNFF